MYAWKNACCQHHLYVVLLPPRVDLNRMVSGGTVAQPVTAATAAVSLQSPTRAIAAPAHTAADLQASMADNMAGNMWLANMTAATYGQQNST